MKKSVLVFLTIPALCIGLFAGCGKAEQTPEGSAQPTTSNVAEETVSAVVEEPTADNTEEISSAAVEEAKEEIMREDGERFEDVIILEGMEETVNYEHIRNEQIGIEMDYDYESFVRQSEPDRECFISVYDDIENPENYLEVTYSQDDADTVAESIGESLSEDYDIEIDSFQLDRAGECIRIDAEIEKGTDMMAEYLQTVYIIPADDGCRIVKEHYYIVDSEGFAKRLSYIVNTIKSI